jgi:SAM-dependent methyltransferase
LVRASSAFAVPGLVVRSFRARNKAKKSGIPGLEFDRFGRRLGLRLMRSGQLGLGAFLLLNPVSIVRYFEFPFTARSVPPDARKCADISSPRLFALYWSANHPGASVEMFNPDPNDLAETRRIAAAARIPLQYINSDIRALGARPATYDSIWAISVLEHIHGDYDDRDAIGWLYSALRPGGVMVLTITTDRAFWDEFRDVDPYGLDKQTSGPVFFQRWYDLAAVHERLIDPLPGAQTSLAFFGETRRGAFKAYEAEWIRLGLRRSVDDPREIADNFREYPSWEAMPGAGVCGLRIVKPGPDAG